MSRFENLKLFGRKRIKFNQTKCMDNELYYDSYGDARIDASSGGMCFVFSHAYVHDFLATDPSSGGNFKLRGLQTQVGASTAPSSASGFSRTGGGGNTDVNSLAIVRAAL